jgi:cytochrome c553
MRTVFCMSETIMGSGVRSSVVIAALACGLLGSAVSSAQDQPAAGDAARGRTLSYTCLGCHGITGYKNAYPNYSVPKLEGQHAEYIVIALQAYRSGERSHMTMHSQASSLSDQDMADVAAFFAGKPLQSTPNNPANKPPKAAETCVACHGPDGVGITGQYPNLAGQHADYIRRALTEYKEGGRKNPIMAGFAATLKPEDIAQVAEYYSQRQPSLNTVEHPISRFSAQR